MLTTEVIQGTEDKGESPRGMEGDGRPTTEVAVACGRGCRGRGVHLTPAPRDQDHQHEVRRQGPGGRGKGDEAASPRLFVVAPHHSSEGRAGRLQRIAMTLTRMHATGT